MISKHYLVFFLLILVSLGAQHRLRQLTQLSSAADDIKKSIFRYIEKIDFRPEANLGDMIITNKTNCVPLIVKQNLTMMSSITYGKGRAIALGSAWLYEQSMLFKDDPWIIFMRNIIAWITKDKQNSQDLPLKILMISSQVRTNFSSTLKRAHMHVSVVYEQSVKNVNLSQYDCILIEKIDNKLFGDSDVNKVVQYVRNGGGLSITLKGWIYRYYQANNAQDWLQTCPYNKITRPMGLYFNDQDKGIQQLTFTPDQTLELQPIAIKEYARQQNPDYIKDYDSQAIQALKNDKSFLLDGIDQIKFNGVGFSYFLYSRDSYIPLFSHENKDIIVAGRFGQGKLIMFGNSESLQFSRFNSDAQKKLLINSVEWMSGTQEKYVIGCLFDDGGWNIQEKQKPSLLGLELNTEVRIINSPEQLQGVDILCVTYLWKYPTKLTPTFIKKITEYVRNGGNLMFGSLGWVWRAYGQGSTNKSLVYEKNFASLAIIQPFNIFLVQNAISANKIYKIGSINQDDQEVHSFLENDLLSVLRGEQDYSISLQEARIILDKIQSTTPYDYKSIFSLDLYHQIVDAFIQSRFNPQKNNNINTKDPITCSVFKIMNAISYAIPPHICRALPPSLNKYPGAAMNKIYKKTVRVFKNKNQRIYTGLYINPGEVIKIVHTNNYSSIRDVTLRINLNDDLNMAETSNLGRFLEIRRTFNLAEKQFTIASPHGGIIFFNIDQKSNSTLPLTFQIYGAYQMPYWNQAINTFAEFKNIQTINAPYFIIQFNRLTIIGLTEQVFDELNINVRRLAQFWNKVLGYYFSYNGITVDPFNKQSFFHDVHISVGWMHSGNPIMAYSWITFIPLGIPSKLYTQVPWGYYHQLGHNYQDWKWEVKQTIQVTNNIYCLYIGKKMQNASIDDALWTGNTKHKQQVYQSLIKYFNDPNKTMKKYGENSHVALLFYAIIMEELGYEVFPQVQRRYKNIQLDSYKFDILVEQVSIVSGHNLWPYFKKWGMPVSSKSQTKIKNLNLKTYKCIRFPFITE